MADGVLADPINCSSLVMKVVNLGLATYHELSTVYDYEDVLDLLEIHEVSEHNKILIMEAHDEFTNH